MERLSSKIVVGKENLGRMLSSSTEANMYSFYVVVRVMHVKGVWRVPWRAKTLFFSFSFHFVH